MGSISVVRCSQCGYESGQLFGVGGDNGWAWISWSSQSSAQVTATFTTR